jgi:uncharacterized protein YodC (DUF2158 family)
MHADRNGDALNRAARPNTPDTHMAPNLTARLRRRDGKNPSPAKEIKLGSSDNRHVEAVIGLSSPNGILYETRLNVREEIMDLKQGDVVMLKSGGHPMTVATVKGDAVECLWMGGEGDLFRETLPLAVLERAEFDPSEDDEDEEDDEEEDEDEGKAA